MADNSRPRRHELGDLPATRMRTISGSEAIRSRVNKLLTTPGLQIPEPIAPSVSQASQTSHDSLDSFLTSPTIPRSHSLKRRKTPRENRNGELELSILNSKTGRQPGAKRRSHRRGTSHHDETTDEDSFHGRLATTEFDRLRKEIESLKEALHETKKANKRQAKRLEETKSELNNSEQAVKDKDSEMSKLRAQHASNEEVLSTIESSIQCQICMDLPERPFALAPCGHVLCLPCLQEWFKKAPPTTEDAGIDPEELTDPHYVLMRSKSCPSCRTTVRHRPVPVFMVKSVVNALQKHKDASLPRPSAVSSSEIDSDPWKDIFPASDEETLDDDDDDGVSSIGDSGSDSDVASELRSAVSWYRRRATFRRSIFQSIDSPGISEDEEHQDLGDDVIGLEAASESDDERTGPTNYVRMRWAPPTVSVDPAELDLSDERDPDGILNLLRRGCSWEMIQNYEMAYHHASGVVLSLRSLDDLYVSDEEGDGEDVVEGMHRIFLGWNISLDPHDEDGEGYIADVLHDIKRYPERWLVTPRPGMRGAMEVRKLVPAVDADEYDTTDTELWIT